MCTARPGRFAPLALCYGLGRPVRMTSELDATLSCSLLRPGPLREVVLGGCNAVELRASGQARDEVLLHEDAMPVSSGTVTEHVTRSC